VHDVCTGKTVAHFRAHKEPLSYLAFDPSGTLLVTAGAGGYEFNIFQIRPSSGALHENALPLYARHPSPSPPAGFKLSNCLLFSFVPLLLFSYTLVRGRTSAAITDITFSNDSRWMAVSTSHGTTRTTHTPSCQRAHFPKKQLHTPLLTHPLVTVQTSTPSIPRAVL
jgi:WD40 repeat protein